MKTVRIRATHRASRIGGTTFADTAPGIGSQDIERIFNPLFTTKSGGMGMGLLICRAIIEAHDGRLWVAPNKPEGAVLCCSPTVRRFA
jgi:signal transduction histidine kinase